MLRWGYSTRCCSICYDYTATMNQINNQVRMPSTQYQYQLTSACSPTYVKPTNEGIKYGSYMRVIYRRRALCE